MTDQPIEQSESALFIADAERSLRVLNSVLLRALEAFVDQEPSDQSPKTAAGIVDVIKNNSKILQALTESEADIAKCRLRQASGSPSPAGSAIDLDQARRDVAAEILRFADARLHRGGAGEPG